jgi:glycosyltransferase involved in cell wall biosynthesis
MKLPITVILAIKNEEVNLPKCLESINLAEKIFVVDSGSTDNSVDLCESFGATVIQFNYTGRYPKKRQWALENLNIGTEWVLLLDADEVVPKKLWGDIESAINSVDDYNAYQITKSFHFLKKELKYGGFSFGAVLLVKHKAVRFEELFDKDDSGLDMEVHERVIVQGNVGIIKEPLIHDDFKSLQAYIDRHNKYSTWEAGVRYDFIRTGNYGKNAVNARLLGNVQERRRFYKKIAIRVPFEPTFWFLYHYVFKLGFLEGRRGLIAAQIRKSYIEQVRAKIFELKNQ